MKKRIYNTGSIHEVGTYKDGRKKYRGSAWVRMPDGASKRVYTSIIDNATEVNDVLLPYLIEESSGGVISTDQTVESYLIKWCESDPELAPRTVENRLMNCNHRIIPYIGQYLLKEIGAAHIEKVYETNKHLSRNSKVQIRRALNKALEDAVADKQIKHNPMHDYRRHPKKENTKIVTLTDRDQDALLAVQDNWRPLWVMLLDTGVRVAEALGLKWSNVHADEGYIEVRQQLQRINGALILRRLKTDESKRDIELDDRPIEVLRDMRAKLQNQKVVPLDGLLFPNTFGGGLEHKVVSRAFRRSLEKAGIKRHYTMRDLRRTHATVCAEADLPVMTTQQRLGHKDPSITLKYYTNVTDRMRRQGATKLNEYKGNRNLDADLDAGSRRSSDN